MSLFLACLLAFGLIFTPQPHLVQAVTNPLSSAPTVSATVGDNSPPTTPVLVSPTDNSSVTTGQVSFVWDKATDDNGIKNYQLYLDGAIYLNNLPTTDNETAAYTLTYDATSGQYTLQVKDSLADGSHTWKIRVHDTLNNGTDSATWTFTIDTQAPTFTLTQVGTETVSISAQDVSTVPATPIQLNDNEPQLLGNGEADSSVVVVVTIPDDPTQTYTDSTDVNGNWGHQLGILPRETTITLDFTITDQAGLVSVLNGVKLLIKQQVLTFPPTQTTPTPSPTPIIPGLTTPTPSPTPLASPTPTPLFSIPITPPKEIVHEIIQEGLEYLPQPLKAVVSKAGGSRTHFLTPSFHFLGRNAAFGLALLLVGLFLLALARRFGPQLSPHLVWRTLQALGILPAGKPQGLVYQSQTQAGVAFVLVEVTNPQGQVIDSVLTNKDGLYKDLRLPPGQYTLSVKHHEFRFPSNRLRPNHLELKFYYRGEEFKLTPPILKDQLLFLIPVDSIAQQPRPWWRKKFVPTLHQAYRVSQIYYWPLFISTVIINTFFPTPWNLSVLGAYLLSFGSQALNWLKQPTLTGSVTNAQGSPLADALVVLINPELNQLAGQARSQSDGHFALFAPKQPLSLTVIKNEYVWTKNQTPLSNYPVDLSYKPQHITISLFPHNS